MSTQISLIQGSVIAVSGILCGLLLPPLDWSFTASTNSPTAVVVRGNNATVAEVPRDVVGDGRWMSQHKRFLKEAAELQPRVAFFGDSIVYGLRDTTVWKRLFEPLNSVNFGISGDYTQHLLWRLLNGALDHMSPHICVVLIGTNNFRNSAPEVAEGITRIASVIHGRMAEAHIIVIALLPRGEWPNDARTRNAEVNALLPKYLSEVPNVRLIDLDPGFVKKDGSIDASDMLDYLHLTEKAYNHTMRPLHSLILQLLNIEEPPEVTSTRRPMPL